MQTSILLVRTCCLLHNSSRDLASSKHQGSSSRHLASCVVHSAWMHRVIKGDLAMAPLRARYPVSSRFAVYERTRSRRHCTASSHGLVAPGPELLFLKGKAKKNAKPDPTSMPRRHKLQGIRRQSRLKQPKAIGAAMYFVRLNHSRHSPRIIAMRDTDTTFFTIWISARATTVNYSL